MASGLVLLCPLLAVCFLCFRKLMEGAVSSIISIRPAGPSLTLSCPDQKTGHHFVSILVPHTLTLPHTDTAYILTNDIHTSTVYFLCLMKTFCIIYRLCMASLFCHILLSQVETQETHQKQLDSVV